MRQASAFTLMELVLVMVIVSILLGLCAPSLRGFFASRGAADTASSVLALTRWARSDAIAQGRICRLNIDSEAATYWLTVQENGTFTAPRSDIGRRFSLPQGCSISAWADSPEQPVSFVQFYPNGRSDAATIEISGPQGDPYRVTCPSATEMFQLTTAEAPGR